MKIARMPFLLLLFSMLLLCSCTGYELRSEPIDGVRFGVGQKDVFVFEVQVDPRNDECITLPNEVDGKPVTKLGGYAGTGLPCAFDMVIDEEVLYEGYSRFSVLYEYTDLSAIEFQDDILYQLISDQVLTKLEDLRGKCEKRTDHHALIRVVLPDATQEIDCQPSAHQKVCYYAYLRDGELALDVYTVDYFYEISPDNAWFYTRDGKVYSRETDEMVIGLKEKEETEEQTEAEEEFAASQTIQAL